TSPLRTRTASRRFTVATRDYFGAVLLPGALELLGREAPGVDLSVLHVDGHTYPALLETGAVDLTVVSPPVEAGPGLRQKKLLTEDFVCVVRKEHPTVRRTLDLDTYLKLSHILISPRATAWARWTWPWPGAACPRAASPCGCPTSSSPRWRCRARITSSPRPAASSPRSARRTHSRCSPRPSRCRPSTSSRSGTSASTATPPTSGCADSWRAPSTRCLKTPGVHEGCGARQLPDTRGARH
ncbi:LysR substrate-binding domain-containing protein, partial [Corallococcus sp. 4LFB]|uniref:LysR substrate-binding domain-containing protein n=1 Tax=Corallococcus sp. 4LFB TaxID=3383249 RepID=UPI0039762BE3